MTRLERAAALASIIGLAVTIFGYLLNDSIRAFLGEPMALPRWAVTFLILALLAAAWFCFRIERRVRIGSKASSSAILIHERPTSINSSDSKSIAVLPASVLKLPKAGLSTWIYVSRFDDGIRRLVNNRYIFAHATHATGRYKNVFALCRGPVAWEPATDPQWKLWLANADGEGKDWEYPDARTIEPGWHMFLVRWDHATPLLELIIDDSVVLRTSDYEKYWPMGYSSHLVIGCWPNKWSEHYADTYFWRTQVLEYYPDQEWVKRERSINVPPIPL